MDSICGFFLPGAALGIVGGILFGPLLGTFYTALGSTIGAVAVFLAGKYVVRDLVKGLVEKNPKLKKIDEGVKKEGWQLPVYLYLQFN